MARFTFPRIKSERHPLADGSRVRPVLVMPISRPDDEDFRIAKEIIGIHRELQRKFSATGEWLWINKHKKKEYLEVLKQGKIEALAEIFANLFRNPAVYGLITSDFFAINSPEDELALESQILLDLDAWREFTEQDDEALMMLDMPRVGNPYGVLINKVLVSTDNPRHDYFALKIAKLAEELGKDRPHILEIGGGYGGLALQVQRRLPFAAFMDCDLPESLYLAYYFLRKATNKKIVWALGEITPEVWDADVILVPASNARAIAGPVDILFNCHSLSEMAKETIDEYMALLHRLGPAYFLHQNSNFLLFPKSPRHLEILASQFPIDRNMYQEVYRAISPWQGGGGRYREFLYKKIEKI